VGTGLGLLRIQNTYPKNILRTLIGKWKKRQTKDGRRGRERGKRNFVGHASSGHCETVYTAHHGICTGINLGFSFPRANSANHQTE
jgi:hypothetical protein